MSDYALREAEPAEISTLSLDDALPILDGVHGIGVETDKVAELGVDAFSAGLHKWIFAVRQRTHLRRAPLLCPSRSEEHTSELQSHRDVVCRHLLEKKIEVDRQAIHSAP